jgi:putative hemolysin
MNAFTHVSQYASQALHELSSPYEVRFAQTDAEMRAAQRLRYEVFIQEGNQAHLRNAEHLERDGFDPYCLHIIAIDKVHGDVVGTYRALLPEGRAKTGRYYMEGLFDMPGLCKIRQRTAEIDRACIHPRARSSVVLMRMWSALAKTFAARGIRYVVGAASLPVNGRPAAVMRLYREICVGRKCELSLRVEPRAPAAVLAANAAMISPRIEMPAALRGYLQLGAEFLGEPAYDEVFDCIEIPLVFDLEAAQSRLAQRVLQAA